MIFESREEEEQFFLSIRERIASVAKKRIRGPDYEDIVQETLAILKFKLSQVPDKDRLLPFVFQTLRNCIGNYYQKKKTESKHIADVDPLIQDSIASSVQERSDWHEIMEKALKVLQQDHGRCVDLFRALIDSAEIDELQKLLGVSRENVYRTLYRCRARLKEIITNVLKVSLP